MGGAPFARARMEYNLVANRDKADESVIVL